MSHNAKIVDMDPLFTIDPITREIKKESTAKTTVVQYDHNSEKFTFLLPRNIEGHDMTECNKVEVHYVTTSGNIGVYPVTDLSAYPEDDTKVICTWLLSQNATSDTGVLSFLVRFACVAQDGTIEYAWNTGIYADISVQRGLYNGEAIIEQYADILELWKTQLFDASAEGVTNINTTKDTALSEINTAKATAVKDVENAGDRIIESLPDEYIDVTGKVDKKGIDQVTAQNCQFMKKVIGENKCNPYELEWNAILTDEGDIRYNDSTFVTTGFIKVTDKYAVFRRTKTGTVWASWTISALAKYDKDKNFIEIIKFNPRVDIFDCTGAEYIKIYGPMYALTEAPKQEYYTNFVPDTNVEVTGCSYSMDCIIDEQYIPKAETDEENYGERVEALEKDMVSNVTGYPYINNAVNKIVSKLKDYSENGNIVTFGFNTDQHIIYKEDAEKNGYSYSATDLDNFLNAPMRGLSSMAKISQKYPLDFICLGGDFADPHTYNKNLSTSEEWLDSCKLSARSILSQAVDVQSELCDAMCPVIPLVGNHEAQDNRPDMTGDMFFGTNFRRIISSGYIKTYDDFYTNGYHDDDGHKIRFIFLDTNINMLSRQNLIIEPLEHLKNVYEDMLSTAPENYSFIVFSHHPIVQGDKDHSIGSGYVNLESISGNYKDRIICCISGHVHKDKSTVFGDILYIATRNASWVRYLEYYDENGNKISTKNTSEHTEDETAYDIFVVDQFNRTINAIRYGRYQDERIRSEEEIANAEPNIITWNY